MWNVERARGEKREKIKRRCEGGNDVENNTVPQKPKGIPLLFLTAINRL